MTNSVTVEEPSEADWPLEDAFDFEEPLMEEGPKLEFGREADAAAALSDIPRRVELPSGLIPKVPTLSGETMQMDPLFVRSVADDTLVLPEAIAHEIAFSNPPTVDTDATLVVPSGDMTARVPAYPQVTMQMPAVERREADERSAAEVFLERSGVEKEYRVGKSQEQHPSRKIVVIAGIVILGFLFWRAAAL